MDFTEKYYLYRNTVFRVAYSYMGNTEDAEDIMQNVFLILLNKGKKFETEEDEKRWLIRVTINLCINEKKTFWNRNKSTLNEDLSYCVTETDHEIRELIHKLKPKERTSIYLYYMEGYSVKEIAEILHISESAVKMRLKRGRQQLEQELLA